MSKYLWNISYLAQSSTICVLEATSVGAADGCRAVFKPRSAERVALIRSEWAEASKLIDSEGNYTEAFYEQTFATQRLK